MSEIPYPYTDETPEERRRLNAGPLITDERGRGKTIYVGKVNGDEYDVRDDLTVFIPNHQNWACVLDGSPDDDERTFTFRNVQEMKDVVAALNRAMVIMRENVKSD